MRKKHRNEIFHLLANSGLHLDDFDLVEVDQGADSLPTTVIHYKRTPLKFIIRNSLNSFESFDFQYIPFGPGYQVTDIMPPNGFVDIDVIKNNLNHWLINDVKGFLEEQSEPDLWNEFKKGNKSLNINEISFDDKSAFGLEEKNQVSIAINELKHLIHKNLETTVEEQKLVIERLDYLANSTARLNKFDWKSLAISTLISISLSLTLDTQKGQMLFDLFKKVFTNVPMLLQGQ